MQHCNHHCGNLVPFFVPRRFCEYPLGPKVGVPPPSSRKRPKYLVLNPKNFSRHLRRREIPPYTHILVFYCISISQIFRKIKDFLSLSLFSQFFSLNGIISLSFSYIFLGMPRFFCEGGGSTPKIAMEQKMEQGSHRGRSHP